MTAKGEAILDELATLRARSEELEEELPRLYERQKALYLTGARNGLIAPEMARRMLPDADKERTENLAETIRQHMRANGLAPGRGSKKKVASRT